MPVAVSEELLSLPAAAAEFPHRPSPSTVWRYASRGVRGVKLETIRLGGKVFTSRQAIGRMVAALNSDVPGDNLRHSHALSV